MRTDVSQGDIVLLAVFPQPLVVVIPFLVRVLGDVPGGYGFICVRDVEEDRPLLLFPDRLNHPVLLLTIDPTSENHEIELPGLKNEIHRRAISGMEVCASPLCRPAGHRSTDLGAVNFYG